MELSALLVGLLSLCLEIGYARAQPIDLPFALFTAGPEGGFDSSGSVPAVEIAEEQILISGTILNGYRLRHTAVQETRCDRTNSLNLFFQTIPFMKPPVLGLLGCGCSVASEPVAEIVHHWNISQISYGSSTVTLNNRSRFVNYFRTSPSDATLLVGISTVLEYYGWKQVVFITQMENLFVGALETLTKLKNISIANRMVSSMLPNVSRSVRSRDFFNFEENDYRVFFINAYSDVARIVICEAFKRNLTYPRYVWLTYGWYTDKWWTSKVNSFPINCTDDELTTFLPRLLSVQTFPSASTSNETTDTILTEETFYSRYYARLNTTEAQENNYTYTFTATTAYDATWALAFALDRTSSMINDSNEEIFNKTGCRSSGGRRIVPLENFTYDNDLMGCVIRSHLTWTNFTGVSGEVQFDEAGTRSQTEITAGQYRELDNKEVEYNEYAVIYSNGTFSYNSDENNDTVYPDGIPPDGRPMQVIVTYHLALVIIYDVLAAAGLVVTTICLVFNFVFRKRKVVRLTSPNLNYFIIAGAYIMYVTIFIRIIPSTSRAVNSVTCNLEMFLTTIGYSLAFGTILVKMGRVYHIFHNPTERKKPTLQDWKLSLIILGIMGVGTFLSILAVVIPQLKATPFLVPNNEYTSTENELGVQIEYHAYQCFNLTDGTAVLVIIKNVYLALLQIIGLVLAIQTRKVTVKVLNDSKYIAALIYISSITLVVLVLTTFTLRNFINIYQLLYSGGLLVAITAFLALIFIPKMISLYQDPQGKKIFETSSPSETGGATGAEKLSIGYGLSSTVDNDSSEVEQLKSKVAELEAKLSQYQVAMQ